MGKSSNRSAEYFFTQRYEDDDEGNTIHAIGVGGVINAYGGNDNIVVGSLGYTTVNTTWGHDTIVGAAGYLKVNDTGGDLTVKGGSGFTSINKTQSGPITFEGVSGGVKINHTGDQSGIFYSGAAGYNSITRKGLQGDISFKGAGAYNELWHETNQGNFYFAGAGGANKIDRTWHNRYQGSQGDLTFKGAGAANTISSRVERGNIDFEGAGAANNIVRKGKIGDITLRGAGASNRLERIRQVDDVYSDTQGDIRFEGVGGYNSLYSDVAHGSIHFTGGGAYNEITRKGAASDFNSEGIAYARAEEVVLTTATLSGSWIGNAHQVTGVKSAREPNTYLFAFEDGTHTKINKVQLRNDPETGKLRYYSTAWYKEGKHLKGLEKQDISAQSGFNSVGTGGAYTLSNLTVEQRKAVTIDAVEQKLTENQWVNYGNGIQIDAADITLSDAKMGGYAIYRDGTTVDVNAVKSNRKPHTYVYGKQLGEHTKVVVIELRNDPKTGFLQYIARPLYKTGHHTANLANEDICPANGYQYMGTGSYSLSDLHYRANTVRTNSSRVADMHEYHDLELFKSATGNGDSSGDIHYTGAGGGNVIKSNVTRGDVSFTGAGIANVIEHSAEFGNTKFDGAGGANVIIKKGKEGNLNFDGAGIANVLLHQSQRGDMNVNAGGAANVLVRVGDGRYLAHLLAVGNISIHKGNGNSRISMGGGYNTHTQIGHGDASWTGIGGANVLTQAGNGDVSSVLLGGANILTKVGEGDLASAMLGGANVITHISNNDTSYSGSSNTSAIALGGANVLTKKGKGDIQAVMGGGGNVLTHIGDGKTTGIMLGGANILTKVGKGDTTGIMLGLGNVLTHVGDGQTLGVMGALGNIFTKVGDGTTIAAMVGAGNIFTHVGEGNAWALMGGKGNVFTKVGNGDALALMLALGNVYTHIGDGMSVALMIAKGNIATKVGNGDTLSAMIGKANVFTQIGHGSTFAAMIGGANVLTKVGDDLTAALMVGEANIYTHVGKGTSIGLFAGKANIMTKVGDGTTLSAMFGEANMMSHVGDGLTGVLALGKANIVTKVGNGFMGVVAASEANVVTHVNNAGNSTTAAVLAGKGNILTKVGNGSAVGLLISKVGNIMTHVGDGTTVGFAKGEGNIITKVGNGLGINAAWGKANVLTHIGDGDRYNFAKGDANIITKVGNGQEVTVVQGQANIVTHVGNGDDYTGAWGKANVITKVGDGRNVVLTKGEANIVTQIGRGDSFNALWSQGNIVTKVGDGVQVTAAKGKGNITTTVGNGLSVTAAHGDLNINTKVGDGVSVNVAWGQLNVNTRVGDGLNVSVMKGKGNANIRVGDGLNISASYARNNVAIQVGNGDFYNLAVAESNTQSNKLGALFDNIKQTLLGSAGSQGINYLVNGDEANTSGTHKGRGAIDLPAVSSLNGLKLTEVDEITSDLAKDLKGSVTGVDTPDIAGIEKSFGNERRLNPNQSRNLIVNGDFEQDGTGWQSTQGIEASHSAKAYGLKDEGHGNRVSELDVNGNTHIYQDIQALTAGEEITVKFDFARRAGSSADNGLEVWWNGEVVFAAANGSSEWQNKTLTLTAKAGSNRLEFSGIGLNDGLGYVLDNVVATSELSSDSGVAHHVKQDKAAHNALQDKENAEADSQRLAEEKEKQLAAIAGTQAQLEATDLAALNANGQPQQDAIKEEAQGVKDEMMAQVKGLETLDIHATYHGESGQQWRDQFADGLRQNIQTKLTQTGEIAQNQLDHSQSVVKEHLGDIKDAVAKSEAGARRTEQNRQQAEQDIEEARIQAENRKKEAIGYEQRGKQAGHDGEIAAQQAGQHGQHEISSANRKTAQVQNNAKGSKLDGNYKPTRTGAKGSGLSGDVYPSNDFGNIEKAEQSKSHISSASVVQADGRFSHPLQELDKELDELGNAKEALNRLQINAGIRARKASGGSTLAPIHRETPVSQDMNQAPAVATEWVRDTPRMSGWDLSGLKALGDEHQDLVNTSDLLNQALPFYGLRTERNLLVSDAGDAGFNVRPWPGNNSDSFKTIMMEHPEDPAQIKSIERFILANYDNYDQLPDELHLVNDRIVSHDHGRTRIIAEKVDGSWSYKPKTDLMSVAELQKAAYVKGKILGDGYRNVLDALSNYHNTLQNRQDYDFEAVGKLTDLLHQVESYLKGHPDSKRVPALQNLLSQISVRLDESLVLTEFTVGRGEKVAIDNDGTPPRDKEPFNPVTRFLNDELYGTREDRRNVERGTQIILDDAATKGTSVKVTLQGEAGRLTGYYHNGAQQDQGEADSAKKVVLFIHGSGSSAEEQASAIQASYQKLGVDMLAVNVRGYGASDGHPSEKGLYQDARTMFSYLVNDRGVKPENIIIHGYSMGGAVAADLARYAERNGQPVSGLLLDRPMPSMTKAIAAHEVPNPAGLTAGLSKWVNGQFSVEKNLQGISKQTPIMLLTDNEGLGKEGEKLRAKLVVAGYQVSGEQTFYGHESSGLMNQYAAQIVSTLSEPQRENGSVKAGLLEKIIYTLFDMKSGGKELDKYSFHFTQGGSLLSNLEKLVPEIGNVLLTKGNHVESKEFLEGVCFALSGRYLIEERVHGAGGGKAYLSWLTDAVKAYNDNAVNKKSDINSVETALLNQYRRQNIGPAIQDLLSMQYSQTQNMSNLANRRKANEAYGGKLKANGLTGDRIDHSLSNDVAGYESVMATLRDVEKTTYMSFMSEDHAMAVVVHKGEKQTLWSFYDPNFGIKSFDNYNDFEHFMDAFHKGRITGYKSKLSYQYEASREVNQSFDVNYNTFEDGTITHYDGVWQQARAGEQPYVLRALKEQGKTFKLASNVTGRVVDYGNDAVTLEVTTKKGEKIRVEVESHTFRQAAHLVQSNIDKVIAHSENGKFILKASAENNRAVTALDNDTTQKPDAGQITTDSQDGSEVLKDINSDLKRYGEALQAQASGTGKKPKDIRTTEDFLAGYQQGHAGRVVDGFRPGMNIKQLVNLLVKGHWNPEQKGALAWEIESRALKVTFQPRAEKYNRLFREVASTGIADMKASEQLAPQLLLLNLSNDGFGGRCDPLSKLVLVAKQLENEGQDGVARQLLEKMYSAAAVLSNPDLYSATERANASKLLGSLAALHAKNPMTETSIKVWKEKLEGANALTVDGVIQKITAGNTEGKPVLLELDGPGHAMAAWAKGNGEGRVYGFYDPNVGIVEFSSAEKFGTYVTRFFGESGLNMAQSYHLPKNAAGENRFERVAVIDGEVLATYRPRLADKTTMRGMLELPIFDDTPIKKPTEMNATDGVKKPLGDNSPENPIRLNNQDVNAWENVVVKPQSEGGDSRFNGQIIIQTENDPAVAEAAANLAGKHPDSSVIVQLDAHGQYRVVYGDPAVLSDKLQSGKLRWQIVGHGREKSAQNYTRVSGYSADELALKLKQFSSDFKQIGTPDHISLVSCSLISHDKRDGFARRFISALDGQGIRTTVSARSSKVSVDSIGRKYTKDGQEQWVHKLTDNKIVLGWNDQGEVESHAERVRRGISESDINVSRVGQTEAKAQGAIADNAETFHAPKQRDTADNHSAVASSNNSLSYSGNIQVQTGDGEFTSINWGTTNVGIKVGTGGFKSLAFGDNNVMVHMGDGNSKHSVDIAGYQALEGAQLFVGNRNISFNMGRSNDLIVMLEKSIPTPPLVNPFDGAARISGVLQNIAGSSNSPDWLARQDQQWTLESAKKYVSDLSGLDLTSSVDYKTLTDLDAQNERSSRGLKSDLESTLNKKYNQWLSGNGNTAAMGKVSRADKFRQANEKLAFNFAVGGQGADIQVTTGNWNFMFGDNIQSILDTNLGSLFGLMTQEYTSTGMAKTTFTFSPTDLPRQIKNKLLGNLAGVNADTTLADIFGVDYTPDGGIVSRSGQPVDGVAVLGEMLEVIGEFGGDQLKTFTDPKKLRDGLKAGLNMGAEGVKSFAESHGLKAKAPDENQKGSIATSEGDKSTPETADTPADRAFGLTSLNLPNLFATLFNRDKQSEMKSLVTNLKKNLTGDLLNMQDKTFDFLRNSGHLQGDGDIHVSLGNYNFNWGGDGKDLGAYLGDNNNFWGGRGSDVFYSVGTSNIFAGGEGNDMGVLMGRENMMFGGTGDDVAVLAGRINYAYMGSGDDQAFVFGEGGMVDGGKGRDYIVTAGNFNRIDAGEDQDYVVAIGNNNQVDLGEGNDFATVFGNDNRIDGNEGNNAIKLMGYHAVINGGTGDDHLIADVVSKFSQLNGGDGDDLLVLGGYQNHFKGGTGVNSFVVSGDVIDNVVEDIKQDDKIIFNDINWQNLWLQRSGYDLVLLTDRHVKDTSAQGQFEAMGSVTFNDYFNGKRADIITQLGDKDAQGDRKYTALSANAVDSLVQAMSGFSPNMGESSFIDSLDSKTKSTIMTAWSDTVNGKSKLA
ncbi:MARTX multifunctional-autoprocessing repeats-in-toxin holotoxin RtxA [Xenorhabdus kozodoii]|uniref:Autotransporter adhesin n=1 Tax=Xenorhabdus kozodoii TaxID=351676 RepID=A0A2D0KZQ1_9GAMM|nr:MARTX multifunctional-autoprocessing repeats-in-toxin holotoxin RtxA [Xenorhabdus kozodoii]PHM68910.1 Autotransporter adhesin [Xenorhabdus kozodoii]